MRENRCNFIGKRYVLIVIIITGYTIISGIIQTCTLSSLVDDNHSYNNANYDKLVHPTEFPTDAPNYIRTRSIDNTRTTTDSQNNNIIRTHSRIDSEWNTTACRQKFEKEQFTSYRSWLTDQVPLLHYATVINQTAYIVFITYHLQGMKNAFEKDDWICTGDNGLNVLNVKAFQVIKSSRSGYIVVSCEYKGIHAVYNLNRSNVKYNISTLIQCDYLEEKEREILMANYDYSYHVKAKESATAQSSNSPSSSQMSSTNIGACTMIQGTESRQLLQEWVEYHRLIGIDHFWVFINEDFSLNHLPDELPYVTYVPYDFDIKPHYNYTSYRYDIFILHVINVMFHLLIVTLFFS